MKKRHALAGIIVALALTAFVFAGPGDKPAKGKNKSSADTKSLMNKKAPAFDLQTLDGQNVKLEDLKGNVVLLDFWATWCPPCREALPHVQSLASNTELTEKGLKVLAINLREGDDKITPFMKENSYTFTVPLDKEGSVATSYMVQGIPTQVLIGRDGMIKKVFIGFGGEAQMKEMDQAIETALRAKTPTARGPATRPTQG